MLCGHIVHSRFITMIIWFDCASFFYLITHVRAIVFFRSVRKWRIAFSCRHLCGINRINVYYYVAFGLVLAYVYACGLLNTRIKNTLVEQISSAFSKNHRILEVEWTCKYKIWCRVLIRLIKKVVTINNERTYERVPRWRVVGFYRSQHQRTEKRIKLNLVYGILLCTIKMSGFK